MKFVWRGRPPKVSKNVLAQDIQKGGLKVVDVEAFIKALKMIWIKRMYLNQGSTWRKILQVRIGTIDLCDLIKSCLCKKDIMKFRIPKTVFRQ